MSQAGLVDIEGSHPQIPTSVVTNSGTAIPLANVLEILGTSVAAHSIPLETTGSGNTVTIEVQNASASASSSQANAGVASFNSADFTVDANGFVSTTGGGGGSVTFTGDSGTPFTGNAVTVTGDSTGLSFAAASPDLTLGGSLNVAHGGTGDVSFTAYSVITAGTTSTGALQNVVGVGTSGQVLTSNGTAALPSWQPATGGSGITTIDGDTGSITGSTVTIYSNNASLVSGSSVKFVNSGTTSTLNVSDGSGNTLIGNSAGNATLSGGGNTTIGFLSQNDLTSGSDNSSLGIFSLRLLTSGSNNTSLGFNSGTGLLTGSYNTFIGYQAGASYSSSESSNIIIGGNLTAIAGESNIIRIGATGTGTGQQNKCFLAGITGATPTSANTPQVVLCDNAGNLSPISSSTSGFVLTSNGTGTPTFQAAGGGSGTVTSVTGTANQVAVATGTTTPVISLIGPYTPATYTAHGVLVGEGTSSIVATAVGATGTVLAGNTGADPSFTATPSVTSITLNGGTVLGNYVEGTYTPTVDGAVSGTTTYTSQVGTYIRIGNFVWVTARIAITGATGTGNAQFGALPFTTHNRTNQNNLGSASQAGTGPWTWPVSTTSLGCQANSNMTFATFNACGSAVAQSSVQIANTTCQQSYSFNYAI